ncbi:MAG: hypothetical protein M5U01_19955 [Ardenticatenaceae bacterium]|nr:hypothetical protein [Ardenticatenaceae bacterium]HBY99036.1 hypothetical protein [Chloroflexota bacterium]
MSKPSPHPDSHETESAGPDRKERGGIGATILRAGLLVTGFVLRFFRETLAREPTVDRRALEVGHEVSDLTLQRVRPVVIGFLIMMALVLIVVSALNVAFIGRWPGFPLPPGLANAPDIPLPPEPRLQPEPQQEMQALRAEQEALLHSYGWVDKQAGVVHIPIDRAMQLLAQRGLPAQPTSAGETLRDQGQLIPSDASSGRMMERLSP